jgi:hypothetical protein
MIRGIRNPYNQPNQPVYGRPANGPTRQVESPGGPDGPTFQAAPVSLNPNWGANPNTNANELGKFGAGAARFGLNLIGAQALRPGQDQDQDQQPNQPSPSLGSPYSMRMPPRTGGTAGRTAVPRQRLGLNAGPQRLGLNAGPPGLPAGSPGLPAGEGSNIIDAPSWETPVSAQSGTQLALNPAPRVKQISLSRTGKRSAAGMNPELLGKGTDGWSGEQGDNTPQNSPANKLFGG